VTNTTINRTARGIIAVASVLVLSGCAILKLVDPIELEREQPAVVVEETEVEAASFQVGDCLNDPDTTANGDLVYGAAAVSCSAPHVYELYHEATLRVQSFDEVDTVAEASCFERFGYFVSFPHDLTSLTIFVLQPTPEGYESGDRGVSCLVHRTDMALVEGSLRGLGAECWVEFAGLFALGQCWDAEIFGDSENHSPSEIVECDSPHVYEVYHVGYLSETPEETFESEAEDICDAGYEPFIGVSYDNSTYYLSWFQPDGLTYPLGDRRVACVVHTSDFAPVAESLEGVRR
jgi:hypothetical protein